jgi:hypothetical protein
MRLQQAGDVIWVWETTNVGTILIRNNNDFEDIYIIVK